MMRNGSSALTGARKKGLSPYDAKNWADAKFEYLKAQGENND